MIQQRIVIDQSFDNWTRDDLKRYLGIKQQEKLTVLEDWLDQEIVITVEEQQYLEKLRLTAKYYIDAWNEMELREKLIAKMVSLVEFEHRAYDINTFAERNLMATTQIGHFEVKLHGTADWLTATGLDKPFAPFFFIHEYKVMPGKIVGGIAQLIAEMYTAQLINQKPPLPSLANPNPAHPYKEMPIYGLYVDGRDWFFVALQGNHYAISEGYLFINKGIPEQILRHLKAQKQIIYSYFE